MKEAGHEQIKTFLLNRPQPWHGTVFGSCSSQQVKETREVCLLTKALWIFLYCLCLKSKYVTPFWSILGRTWVSQLATLFTSALFWTHVLAPCYLLLLFFCANVIIIQPKIIFLIK